MKTSNFQKLFLVIVAVGLALSTMTVAAQNSPASAAPPLSYGVPQILQLAQAKVSDDTIIAYIHNSGNSYGLDANQIIYLRQQGVSDNVLTVMLTQPRPASAPAAPPPDNSYQVQAPASSAPAPTTTYVQSAPSPVYVVPNSQPYYYNNYYYSQPYYYPYSYFPSVALSFAFGGSYYHGGYHYGGSHGGGGYYHGGGYGGGSHGGGMGGGMMHH